MQLTVDSGQLPEGWKIKYLDELYENLDSKRVPITKSSRKSGNIPYYGASGIVDYVANYIFDEDLLLVSEDGANLLARTYPIAFSITGKAWVNNHAHILRFKEKITQNFIEYYLNSISLEPYVTGMAQPKLNQKSLNSIPIPFPPLPEQKRIVAILDEAFEGIDRAIANTEKNLANSRELFESYLNAIFTQKGDRWKEVKPKFIPLSTLLSKQPRNGWSPPAIFQTGYGIPVLTLSAVTGFHYDGSRIKLTSVLTSGEAHYWLQEGELLITRSNTPELVGHVAIYDGNPPKAICPDLIMKMTVDPTKADTRFIYYFLRSATARKYLTGKAKGASSTMPKITKQVVQETPIPTFNLSEQQAIVKKLDEIATETQRLETIYRQKIAALNELKQSILQKAFTGELTADTPKAAKEAIAA